MRFDDPELVAREYASEKRFATRRAVFSRLVEGDKAEDLALAALREVGPTRVLEIGSGLGEFAARVESEIGAHVLAVDVSPRMVEPAHAQCVEAFVGNAQQLPMSDGDFDCAVANWVLHHVPDLDRAISEEKE